MPQTGDKREQPFSFHVIPNTHWDREWLYDFQETRMQLVDFMDRLLDLIAGYPEYKTYLLDSQTVLLDDYLEIRPHRKEEIVCRVKQQRLFIGPWYTLPEEHLVSGESLVRNLLVGQRLAQTYGGSMKVGYSPFSYGQASQMPQIYQGFGIDSILFYHGVQPNEAPSEFIFEGADGTQLFASRMGSNARYNFFFGVYRPAVFGKEALDRDYHWKEKGLPFHLCSESHYREHHILLDPVKGLRAGELVTLMDRLKQTELQHVTTTHICCMQGMDSTQPDVRELETLKEIAKILERDVIFHSSLPDWLEAVRASLRKEDLVVLKGERRTPRQLGTRVHLYGDVTSTRVRIKRKNALAEQELQRTAEPLAAVAYVIGAEYPKSLLDMAWRYLLKSHPHDSIAGTGVDQVARDVHSRLDQCRNISAGVKRRALQAIQQRIDNADIADRHVVLTVFNAAPYPRDEVVTAIVDLPYRDGFDRGHFSIRDAATGTPVVFQEGGRRERRAIVRHAGDATMEMRCLRVRVHILLDNVPALGYRTLVITPEEQRSASRGSLVAAPNAMENAYVKVVVNRCGTLDVTSKTTGHTFKGLHYLADNGEAGHAWRHIPPCHDRIVTTLNGRPKIDLVESGPCVARYAVTHTMSIPTRLAEGKGDYVRRLDGDGDDAGRSDETGPLMVRSEFTLDCHARGVAVRTTLTNTCEDHRLRVMFPTRLAATHSSAEAAFDVVERPIDRGADSPWRDTWNPTHPCQRFVDVSDGKLGLALISDGLREYEVTDDADRTIGLTLVRAFEVALTTVAWRWERHPEMKGSQSLGNHEFRYFVYPHAGDWDVGQVPRQADRFNGPLELVQAGPHTGHLAKTLSFLELAPAELLLSAIKRSERGTSLVVRVYNPTLRQITGGMTLLWPPSRVRYLNLNEEPLDDDHPKLDENKLEFHVGAKKIVTMEMAFHSRRDG